jgi:hypothetical protein
MPSKVSRVRPGRVRILRSARLKGSRVGKRESMQWESG